MNQLETYNEKIGEFGVHDPAIIKSGGKFFTLSTHGFYQFRSSTNLVDWTDEGKSCFDNKSIKEELSEGINYCKVNVPTSRNEGSPFWAPDIIKFNNKYHLYYCISSFGSTQSYIGLAESKRLKGPYRHIGAVHLSKEGEYWKPNALDPCVKFSHDKKLYLVYGSYFGGIYIKELDKKTGLPLNLDELGTHIAGVLHAPIEGAYLIYNNQTKYYYLFLSYGGLVDSYNVRVGRARNITGPYFDPSGRALTDEYWDKVGGMIIKNYHFSHQHNTYTAPGHNSILKDKDKYFFVHHTRLNNNPSKHYLNIRTLVFNEKGWPVVMPNRYRYDKVYRSNKNISSTYNVILFEHGTTSKTCESKSINITLNKNLKKHNKFIEFEYQDEIFFGAMYSVYDEGLDKTTLAFSAMSETGETIFAIKI